MLEALVKMSAACESSGCEVPWQWLSARMSVKTIMCKVQINGAIRVCQGCREITKATLSRAGSTCPKTALPPLSPGKGQCCAYRAPSSV